MKNDQIIAAASTLGDKVRGLVVSHRGYEMQLKPEGPDLWVAWTMVMPEHVEDHEVEGYGATPGTALDACADEALLHEEEDDDEGDETT